MNKQHTPVNKKRTPAFIKLKHSINSCLNMEQLETLRTIILKYYKDKKDGAIELMAEFLCKEHDLEPDFDRASAIIHKRLEATK